MSQNLDPRDAIVGVSAPHKLSRKLAVGVAVVSLVFSALIIPGAQAQEPGDAGTITLGVPLTLNLASCPGADQTDGDQWRASFSMLFVGSDTDGSGFAWSDAKIGDRKGGGNHEVTFTAPLTAPVTGRFEMTPTCQFFDGKNWLDLSQYNATSLIPVKPAAGTVVDEDGDGIADIVDPDGNPVVVDNTTTTTTTATQGTGPAPAFTG